jgi:endonuclease/exonuclease/phosphatase family metal-dependent hydrolase
MAAMELSALTWNLFHGRDHPPDPSLRSWRSRLLWLTETNATHAQVNRDLFAEFAGVLAGTEWDVALLQECPPRWAAPLAEATGATAHRVLTSRNSLAPLRALLASLNPDLIAANEGGSNLTLVRGEIGDRRELELSPGPWPERRAMAFTRAVPSRCASEVCVANLHASAGAGRRALAEREVATAAERARSWAGHAPLIFGGDLNLRPRDSALFGELAERHGLTPPTGDDSLDHLLVAGLDVRTTPAPWPPERREVPAGGGRVLRLSDHAPVQATFVAATERRAPGASQK